MDYIKLTPEVLMKHKFTQNKNNIRLWQREFPVKNENGYRVTIWAAGGGKFLYLNLLEVTTLQELSTLWFNLSNTEL